MRVVGDDHNRRNLFAQRAAKRADVAVVDDQLIVARLVVGLIERAGYSADVAYGETLELTWSRLEAIQPRLLLLDFDLGPHQSSFEILQRARGVGITVAGFSGSDDLIEQARYVEAGAAAIVNKNCGPTDLIAVVEMAVAGHELMAQSDRHALLSRLRKHRERARARMASFHSLTAREAETLAMIAAGQGAADIAEEWEVSLATVRSHIRAVLTKLGLSSQLQAAAVARDSGWYDGYIDTASSILMMPGAEETGTIVGRSGSPG